ncbi:MAG: DUF3311 domain-containing protein [Thermogemmatispora sp.]|uniref:DUF3311 domain-containing protein n=1 Tax=Thermogemmatispora sp. TaxID=1968838 RepID=UPI00261D9088|nr:DUF3311 domain-containing protein [Thermogemmatispora sp.]MBX5457501.1 DUF3311 domain-containing protein [Thermogemmatispora sp.]
MVTRTEKRRWPLLLLLIPFIATLLPFLYNSYQPEFIGIPFFYWYQLLWTILGALVTALVYWLKA